MDRAAVRDSLKRALMVGVTLGSLALLAFAGGASFQGW
jgi:hypothetical protein